MGFMAPIREGFEATTPLRNFAINNENSFSNPGKTLRLVALPKDCIQVLPIQVGEEIKQRYLPKPGK